MSDANSGSAILAGNPAGDGAAGQAGTPPASSTTSSSTTGTTGQSGAASGDMGKPEANLTGNWYDNIEDTDLKGYVQNKGWKDPTELAHGYKNLEKLLGSEKIPMPKGAEDKEGWDRVYDAIGRPKTADEYKLPVPEGDPGTFAKAASGKFHELGLSAQQAQSLAAWYNETQQGQISQMQQQSAQKTEADLSAVKSEWGQAYNENLELGRRAAREFGLDGQKLTAIENAMGTGEMLKFMAKIGRGLTEHNFEGGKSTNSFGMTPEAAQSRISALRQDQAWSTKYISGDADAQAEMKRLMSVAYPDQ
jgi:hypothetical protein